MVVELVDEEPIYAAARNVCRSVQRNWNESNLNALTKLILIALAVSAALATMHTWFGIGLFLLVLYGCYRVIRAIVLRFTGKKGTVPICRDQPSVGARPPGASHKWGLSPFSPPPFAAPADPIAGVPLARPAPPSAARWVQRESAALAALAQSPRQRLAGLLGSLVGSALVAFTMCLVMAIIKSFHGHSPRLPSSPGWWW